MPTLQRAGQAIHYTVHGSGPPVLLAHSFLCSDAMWAGQIEALKDRFQLIAVDARGHGRSGPADGPFTLWDSADDHLAVLDELGLETVAWAGLSMGGMAGLRVALRHPGRISKLILLDSDGGPESRFVRAKYVGMSLVARTLGLRPLLGSVAPLMFGRTSLRTRPELVEQWKERWRGLHVPSMLHGIDAIKGREDLLTRLMTVSQPTLVLVGAEDKALPPERSRRLVAALPNARFVELPGAGHLSAVEQPGLVAEAMAAFLAEA